MSNLKKLYDLRIKIKELQAEEKELKTKITGQMDESTLTRGKYLALLESCTRKALDKDKLIAKLGKLDNYYKETSYSKLNVKKVG